MSDISRSTKSQLVSLRDYYIKNPDMISSPFFSLNQAKMNLLADILDRLDINLKGKDILDVGCGSGQLAEYCKDVDSSSYTGLDINSIYLLKRRLESDFKEANFLVANGQYLPFKDASFDWIFCIDVFEHFPDQELAAIEFRRMLRERGGVFLSIPNYSNICGLVKIYEERLGGCPRNTWAPFGSWRLQELEQFMTTTKVKKLFSKAGFKKLKVIGYNREVVAGLFPWIYHPLIPETIKYRFGELFTFIFGNIANIFPQLSLHNFWRIKICGR